METRGFLTAINSTVQLRYPINRKPNNPTADNREYAAVFCNIQW